MTDPKYRLQTLGGLSAHLVGPSTPVLAGRRKRLALLAAVAADPNGGIARDRLLALFWPESDAAHARNALKQLVHAIRRELDADAIVDVSGALMLDGCIMSSDVQDFRSAMERGEPARAAELHRGPFLDGVYLRDVPELEDWIEQTRRSLEVQYSSAVEQLVASAKAAGNVVGSLRWARTLAALDPLSTRAAVILIEALSSSGDVAGAIKHGELHASVLRQELDVGAPAELREALEQLRSSPRAVDAPRGSAQTANAIVGGGRRDAVEHDATRPLDRGPHNRRALWAGAVALCAVAAFGISMRPRDPGYVPVRPGALVPLTHGQTVETDPDISPDGKWLVFAASPPGEARAGSDSRIYVRQVDGGSAVPITPDSMGMEVEPRWSPDGTRIAFRTAVGIYLVPALGGTPMLLIPDVDHDRHLGDWLRLGGWSHDGSRIAYADTGGIWVRDLARGTDRLVTRVKGFGAHSPTWSPDDASIAFVVGTGGVGNVAPSAIWIVPAAGGQAVQLTDADRMNTAPQFARDGLSILYVSNRDGARDIYQQRLFQRRDERAAPTRLTTGSNAISISMSADGRHLVYGAAQMRSNVWSAPILPTGPTPVAAIRPVTDGIQEVECLTVSPDDAWLLYGSNRSGNQDIYKTPLGGGEPIRLTTDPADDFCPSLSPDGKEVAFYSVRGSGNRRVFTMLADGQRQAPALDAQPNEQEWGPGWSPDGRGLIFDDATTGARHVTVVSRLSDARWGARRDLYAFAIEGALWSPDGRYISAISRDSGLVLLSPDGRLVRVLVHRAHSESPSFAVWGRDPGTVYYHTFGPRNSSVFWAVPVLGGRPRLLLNLNNSRQSSRRGEFATDGRRLFFTIAADYANIWMLELLP